MSRRLQFSLKTLFVIVTLAGGWGLVCRLAFAAITEAPDQLRGLLRMTTVGYLALAPAGAVIWIYGSRIKPGEVRRQRLRQLVVLLLGGFLLVSAVVLGAGVFITLKALKGLPPGTVSVLAGRQASRATIA